MSSTVFDAARHKKPTGVIGSANQQGGQRNTCVFVGLSGGVDSSVSAALLKEQGFNVVGVYMKNWSQDFPGMPCPWKEDFQDAKRVAVQLGIGFKMYDFEKEYRQKVVDYMLREFKLGNTPNPDIMCNQEVKFKLFLETALSEGADYIATGHYARINYPTASELSSSLVLGHGMLKRSEDNSFALTKLMTANDDKAFLTSPHPFGLAESFEKPNLITGEELSSERFRRHQPRTSDEESSSPKLLMASDKNKDQTYFLYRVTKQALARTIFPLGSLTKPEVRKLAKKYKLVTADKKESMGICFVGKIGIKDFLLQYVRPKLGKIFDQNDIKIGEHDGAIFYTIGQRHGLNIGGGLPYYVTGKNMHKNEIYVTTNIQDKDLWRNTINLTNMHWVNGEPSTKNLFVRTRHRAPLIAVKHLTKISDGNWQAVLNEEIRALTPGQSAVFYSGEQCLGGGIIT